MDRLTVKLASIVVHIEEYFSLNGHINDRDAIMSGLQDPEVRTFLDNPKHAVFLPKKRTPQPEPRARKPRRK